MDHGLHRKDAEDAEPRGFDKHYSELCDLCGEKFFTRKSEEAEKQTYDA
jgi:hypothetical protein